MREGGGPTLGAEARAVEMRFESGIRLAAAGILLVFTIFGLRLFQLQILEGDVLSGKAVKNSVRSVRLEASRGELVDREGRVLASTRPAFGLELMPSDVRDRDVTFRALGHLLETEGETLRSRVPGWKGRARFQPVVLHDDLSFAELARVDTHRFALPGVSIAPRPRRHYVEGNLAAHLLGSIGEIRADQLQSDTFRGYLSGDVIGQAGLEALLEPHLRGRSGGRNVIVDVAGRVIEVVEEVKPKPGGRVVLSLDLDLQRAAEQAFDEPPPAGEDQPARMGALVALDPRNGDVLALVSRPTYDPNDFAGGIDAETWKGLTEDSRHPLQNRAIQNAYPPGSTYKAIVAAAALQEGVIAPETEIFCPGHFTLGRRTYRCWRKGGHGDVDLHDALKRSCDVYFYQVGLKLGVDRIARYARAFGLGRPSGLPFGIERGGLVPTSEWKERRFKEPWMKGETVSISIGQGFNLTTPMQLAVAFAALANGGRVIQPRVVLSRTGPDGVTEGEGAAGPLVRGELPVSKEVIARVVAGLTAVVEEQGGTGGRSKVPGIRVAGKTGTAQVVRLDHTEGMKEHEVPIKYRDHAWFVAFAPVEAPEIVVAVLSEHGGHGGSAAAPIAQRVLARYFEKTRPAEPEEEATLARN